MNTVSRSAERRNSKKKAIELQERGGAIVCLLNAETLRNPYTAARQLLAKKLQQYEAQIEFVDDAFRDAERKARVDVAIVRVHIPTVKDESDIWERMKKAEAERAMPDPELEALVSGDYIEQAIQLYNTEVTATLELVRQYKALTPYIQSSLSVCFWLPTFTRTSKAPTPVLRSTERKSGENGRNVLPSGKRQVWMADSERAFHSFSLGPPRRKCRRDSL